MTPLQKSRYRLKLKRLQSLCGENYARLSRLLKACGTQRPLEFSLDRAGSITLSAQSVGRYTTDMWLQQSDAHPLQGAMRLEVRLYHDVRLAEVIEVTPFKRVAARHHYPNSAMHQPDEKHQWNCFLSDWLEHLDACGVPQIYHWRAQVSRPAS